MSDADTDHRNAAVAALAAGDHRTAGDRYTRAAWRRLADPHDGADPFALADHGWVGIGLQHLVTSAVCYRVAGANERATRRGTEGVAVARDLQAGASSVQRACLDEFVADFRLVGSLGDASEAYERAATAYREAGDAVEDPNRRSTTPLFQAATAPIQQVARGPADGEIAASWDDLHGDDPSAPGAFLAHRATYKRQRFPSLLDRVVADGRLAAPRGTTAYDTDGHRCPACGSTDVNWVADSTLCLRCSTPTETR